MPVDIDVARVAQLARLSLTPEELERFRRQLGLILEHAARVGEVAAGDIPPTAQPIPRTNVFRADVEVPCLSHEEAMRTAPEEEHGRFKVPRIVEEEDDRP